jgi:hypothetical protein
MLRFLADENFNQRIITGLLRLEPVLDLARVRDIGFLGAEDPLVLAKAAEGGRILLSHDVRTMTRFAHERVTAGEPMPGVFEVPLHLPIGQVIEELILLAHCSLPEEWEGQVRYLPLR